MTNAIRCVEKPKNIVETSDLKKFPKTYNCNFDTLAAVLIYQLNDKALYIFYILVAFGL